MQSNTIAVTRGDTSTVTYTRFSEEPNKSVYVAGDHTPALPHTLSISRVFPKPTKDFAGVSRTRYKVTKGIALASGQVVNLIAEVNFDYPVGVAEADYDKVTEEIKLLAAHSFLETLIDIQEI